MRLLAVEDDPALQGALHRGLTTEGFAVDMAGSAERALDLLALNPYDLIVLGRGSRWW
jgi:DNA-binding response OmpR family regulator